jgi:hypothetical protein
MAIPLGLQLIGMLGLGNLYNRSLQQQDRTALQQGVQAGLGQPNSIFDAEYFEGEEQPLQGNFNATGSGLKADPFNPINQMDFATGIMGLPGGDQFGQSVFSQALQFGQQNQRDAAGFSQRLLEQDRGFDESQASQGREFGFRQDLADQAAFQRADEFQRNLDQQIQLAQLKEGASMSGDPRSNPNLGSIGSGWSREVDGNGNVYDRPLPGTAPYNSAVEHIQSSENAVKLIDEQIRSISGEFGGAGSELWGEESKRQGLRYRQITSMIGRLQNLGVLQEAEAKRLEDSLPDPSSITGALTSRDSMVAAYEELEKLFQNELINANQTYSRWGLGSELAGTTPRAEARAAEIAAAHQAAQAQGITINPGGPTSRPRPGASSIPGRNPRGGPGGM